MQCETEKATIDYEEHGEGRPILLLHGWTMDRRVEIFDYEKIFATRPGWRRIYPDLPGMGRSVAKAGLFRQDDVLDALLAFIDQVLPDGGLRWPARRSAPTWRAPSPRAAGPGSRACCCACLASSPRMRGARCRRSRPWWTDP